MAGGSGANRARQSHDHNAGQTQQPMSMGSHPGPAPYDGPASQPSSQHGDPPRQNPYGPGLGYDPAKPATKKESLITNTRVELPAAAYALDTNVSLSSFGFYNTRLLYKCSTSEQTIVGAVCTLTSIPLCFNASFFTYNLTAPARSWIFIIITLDIFIFDLLTHNGTLEPPFCE